MMKVEVNGIHINVEISGKADGPPVVLSHSLGSGMVMWGPQLDALEPDYRVVCYDMRGHGKSHAPEGPYTLDMLAGDVVGLLDALEMERVHFVGLSIGGMIGQCLGLTHAHRFDSLVLSDTAAIISEDAKPLFEERKQTAREKGMGALVEETLARWFTPAYLKANPPGVELIRKQFLSTPVSGFTECSDAILGLDYVDRLSEIDLPTLIMVGEDDLGTPVAASEAIHQRIPHSELRVLALCRAPVQYRTGGGVQWPLVGVLRRPFGVMARAGPVAPTSRVYQGDFPHALARLDGLMGQRYGFKRKDTHRHGRNQAFLIP
ncbi:MAG: alpha/beta fold hydrolase [Deltaproteobacteria bacterium]|nr:alpha/beta fold hydrolase [Deltaproteobacteria bacterium]